MNYDDETGQVCTCDKYNYPKQVCPYDEDVHNSSEKSCYCCEYCTYQCAMDI